MMRVREKILISKIRSHKDADAFEEIYNTYLEPIYRFVYFKVSSTQEAEDITSEVFLKAWQYLSDRSAPQVRNLQAFVYRIARNLVVDFYRDRAKRNEVSPEVSLELSDKIALPKTAAEKIHDDLMFWEIEKNIKHLKDEYREVILLRFVEELSTTEIADILEKTVGSTRVLIHRALKALREIVSTNKKFDQENE